MGSTQPPAHRTQRCSVGLWQRISTRALNQSTNQSTTVFLLTIDFFLPSHPPFPKQPPTPLAHFIHHPPHHPKQPTQPKTPPLDSNSIDEEIDQSPITANKDNKDTEVPPFLRRANIQRVEILGPITEGAVSTPVRRIHRRRISEISLLKGIADISASVVGTADSAGGAEEGGFGWGADDGDGGEGCGEDSADPVRGRVDVVHPVAPEGGELGVGADDAVEEGEGYEEEREDLDGGLVSW
jgi:hypothetical protein